MGGVAVLGLPTGGVADPLSAADPVLGAEGRGEEGTPTSNPSGLTWNRFMNFDLFAASVGI